MLLVVEFTKLAVALAPLTVIPRKRNTKARARNLLQPIRAPPVLLIRITNPSLKKFSTISINKAVTIKIRSLLHREFRLQPPKHDNLRTARSLTESKSNNSNTNNPKRKRRVSLIQLLREG
ncbi:hypothetical protein [Thermococcus thioreducens]|uniref:hypothetical protein n=1 Tax=Thermococcus thioreducens TaxID=277988 RepID=UPI0012FC84CC|nr:hypothetical protein [Thermococcus thioreducens]